MHVSALFSLIDLVKASCSLIRALKPLAMLCDLRLMVGSNDNDNLIEVSRLSQIGSNSEIREDAFPVT